MNIEELERKNAKLKQDIVNTRSDLRRAKTKIEEWEVRFNTIIATLRGKGLLIPIRYFTRNPVRKRTK